MDKQTTCLLDGQLLAKGDVHQRCFAFAFLQWKITIHLESLNWKKKKIKIYFGYTRLYKSHCTFILKNNVLFFYRISLRYAEDMGKSSMLAMPVTILGVGVFIRNKSIWNDYFNLYWGYIWIWVITTASAFLLLYSRYDTTRG